MAALHVSHLIGSAVTHTAFGTPELDPHPNMMRSLCVIVFVRSAAMVRARRSRKNERRKDAREREAIPRTTPLNRAIRGEQRREEATEAEAEEEEEVDAAEVT